ncbi:MAG TPA: thioesterase family protein [Chitinophagaceae bacterium]|nr:thioesterase family protein [Chitinophagaceae bacterium]
MFTDTTTIRVRYAETDQMGVVYHSHYLVYFEVARGDAVRHSGLTYADLEKKGVIMPIVEINCRYLRPARYDNLLTIKTFLKEMPTDHKITFHHEVYNEQNELLTTAKVILYFMDAQKMKPVKMPEVWAKKLQAYFNSPP